MCAELEKYEKSSNSAQAGKWQIISHSQFKRLFAFQLVAQFEEKLRLPVLVFFVNGSYDPTGVW